MRVLGPIALAASGFPLAGLVALLAAGPAVAGPPYLTDDPEPVEVGHWEVYSFSMGSAVHGDIAGILPGIEVNYGALPNLQLHVMLPDAFNSQHLTGTQFGLGDVEFGAKFRFLNSGEEDWWPEIATFPQILPDTGNASRGLGTGGTHAFLPIWLQKNWGRWTSFGGGGYGINGGPGNRNYWFVGWALQNQVTDDLALGGEIFHQTQSATGGPGSVGYPFGSRDSTGFNLGGVYDITEHYHLLFSAGTGLQNAATTDQFSWYLGVQWTF